MRDSKDDFYCPRCGCRLLWFPVSHRFVCESCEQSFDKKAETYLRYPTKSPVGDSAAMRDALEAMNRIDTRGLKRLLCELVEADIFDGGLINKTITAVEKARTAVEKARRTLSASARNCDLYDNWYDAHQAWERLPKDVLGYFVDANGVHECEQAWLFAPAAERKGEGDGK